MTNVTVPVVEVSLIVALAAFLLWVMTYHGTWLVRAIKKWLFTTDHRRIGLMYIVTGILFFSSAGSTRF